MLPLRGSLRVEVSPRRRRRDRGDVRPRRPRLACSARSPTSPTSAATARRDLAQRRRSPRWRCRRRAASAPPRGATAPPRTCRSRCAAPGRRPARSPTSASPGCGTTPRSWSAASCSRRPATGRATRRTSTTRPSRARWSTRRSTTTGSPEPTRSRRPRTASATTAPTPAPEHEAAGLDADRRDARGARRRRGAGAARLPRAVHGGAGLPDVLPQRDGRPGDERSMAFCDDPAHAWVRDSWAGVAIDPRCPMTSAPADGRPRPSYDDARPDRRSTMTGTIRLTTAQALVRWMIAQRSRAARRHRGAAVRRASSRSSATATCSGWAPPCTRCATSCRPGAARTSRAWRWPPSASPGRPTAAR